MVFRRRPMPRVPPASVDSRSRGLVTVLLSALALGGCRLVLSRFRRSESNGRREVTQEEDNGPLITPGERSTSTLTAQTDDHRAKSTRRKICGHLNHEQMNLILSGAALVATVVGLLFAYRGIQIANAAMEQADNIAQTAEEIARPSVLLSGSMFRAHVDSSTHRVSRGVGCMSKGSTDTHLPVTAASVQITALKNSGRSTQTLTPDLRSLISTNSDLGSPLRSPVTWTVFDPTTGAFAPGVPVTIPGGEVRYFLFNSTSDAPCIFFRTDHGERLLVSVDESSPAADYAIAKQILGHCRRGASSCVGSTQTGRE